MDSIEGEEVDQNCQFWLLFVDFDAVYGVDDVKIFFERHRRAGSTQETYYFVNRDYESPAKAGEELSVELGDIRPGDSFYIPVALECAIDSGVGEEIYLLDEFMLPHSITYYDDVLEGGMDKVEIRQMLKNGLVDITGIEGRG